MMYSRRCFLGTCAATAALPAIAAVDNPPAATKAKYWEANEDKSIICRLCPNECRIANAKRGACQVRENQNGVLFSLSYGRPVAINTDPIEKKPFFHVYPGSKAFSIATAGCNISCKFCQNWEISQVPPEKTPVDYRTPKMIAQMASADKQKPRALACTYSEPTIFFEYMVDCAKAAKDVGIDTVVVSNGYIQEKPLKELCKHVKAIKIDFKAFSDDFYRNVCAGHLAPVLETLKTLSESDVWFEIVTLVIPKLNDDMDEIARMSAWIVKELGPDVPVHFTRFHPEYKLMNITTTPVATLHKARATAMKEGCHYVYTGNMPGGEGEKTFCPKCGEMLIHRYGFFVISNDLAKGKCSKCGCKIPGVWS